MLKSGLGKQMLFSSNLSSRTDQTVCLWASDIMFPSFGFFISEKENITKCVCDCMHVSNVLNVSNSIKCVCILSRVPGP